MGKNSANGYLNRICSAFFERCFKGGRPFDFTKLGFPAAKEQKCQNEKSDPNFLKIPSRVDREKDG